LNPAGNAGESLARSPNCAICNAPDDGGVTDDVVIDPDAVVVFAA
jgi:hypothetical protein